MQEFSPAASCKRRFESNLGSILAVSVSVNDCKHGNSHGRDTERHVKRDMTGWGEHT